MRLARTFALVALSVDARRDVEHGFDFLTISENDSFTASTSARPPLCDTQVVLEACADVNGGDSSTSSNQISSATLRRLLYANSSVMLDFWHAASLPTDRPVDGGDGYWVGCAALCSAVVRYAGVHGVVPPTSDVGCYTVGQQSFCDVALDPKGLPKLGPGPNANIPDLHDEDVMYKMKTALAQFNATEKQSFMSISEGLYANGDTINYGVWEVAERVANIFRIYPTHRPEPGDEVDTNVAGNSLAEASGLQQAPIQKERLHKQKVVEAKAYVGIVVRQFNKKATEAEMTKWFGSKAFKDSTSRSKIVRVLNSVDHMIGNVHAVFGGPECTDQTYAYVYPEGAQCSAYELRTRPCTTFKGKFVFYLCDVYFSRPAEMVETLVHEGSHHATAFTDDVQNKYGVAAYGRSTCMNLARDEPQKALDNADNYCYYIQDVAVQQIPGASAHSQLQDNNDDNNDLINDFNTAGHIIGRLLMMGGAMIACCCCALCCSKFRG